MITDAHHADAFAVQVKMREGIHEQDALDPGGFASPPQATSNVLLSLLCCTAPPCLTQLCTTRIYRLTKEAVVFNFHNSITKETVVFKFLYMNKHKAGMRSRAAPYRGPR